MKKLYTDETQLHEWLSNDCDHQCDAVYLATEVDAHLAALQAQHAEEMAEKDREIKRLRRPLIRAEDAETIKWFAGGAQWSLEGGTQVILIPANENTGPPPENKTWHITNVPEWVSRRVNIGETISMQEIDGVPHWYIEGVEVFQ